MVKVETLKRSRLSAAERRSQILEAAEALLLEHGYLPLPVDQLAKSIDASKALIYAYFPTQEELFNALLEHRLQHYLSGARATKSDKLTIRDGLEEALRYYEHVCRHGPILHYLLRDAFLAKAQSDYARTLRDRAARPYARLLKSALKLTPREAVAAFTLFATIPEEAGVLVHRGELAPEAGREMVSELLDAALKAIRKRA